MPGRPNKLNTFAGLASFIAVVAMLYWGREVLVPIALATMLAFLLGPLVTGLRRWNVKHGLAVMIVVILAFSILGGASVIIGRQFGSLALQLPRYETNIRQKIRDLRHAFRSEGLDRARRTLEEIQGEFKKGQTNAPVPTNAVVPAPTHAPAPALPQNPLAAATSSSILPGMPEILTHLLGPISYILASAGLVIVLVIFMLLRRDDLRNRLILLGGLERQEVTARILNEVSQRITRYLLTYTLVNSIYGVTIAIGLSLIGLPYGLLWGFFAGVARFVPYVGAFLGMLLPTTLALAVFPGWQQPLFILGYYAAVELGTNMLLEPIFYGRSAGVSEVALVIALAFWAWVWGAMGLLLGTPLTVCLVVLAKHVPGLEKIHLLIGDGPTEEKCLIYYEHLCMRKDRRARNIIREHVKQHAPDSVYDELFLPALVFTKRDTKAGKVGPEGEQRINRSIRKGMEIAAAAKVKRTPEPQVKTERDTVVTGIPENGESAELALLMLGRILPDIRMEVVPTGMSADEYCDVVLRKGAAAVCVGAIQPHSKAFGERLTNSLRRAGYSGPVVLAEWGLIAETDRRLGSVLGPEYEGTSLDETRKKIVGELGQCSVRNEHAFRDAGIEAAA